MAGTFYYLCTVLDGCSRYIVSWDLREHLTTTELEIVVEKGRESFPGVNPRIISDNGPQFISSDFKQYIRLTGMTHARISPYYPQSNGKIERYHRTIKSSTIRVTPPSSYEEAMRPIATFVAYSNEERLHSAIDYVTPPPLALPGARMPSRRPARPVWRPPASCVPVLAVPHHRLNPPRRHPNQLPLPLDHGIRILK